MPHCLRDQSREGLIVGTANAVVLGGTHSNMVKQNSEKVQKLLCAVVEALPKQRTCRCQEWYDRAVAARA